MAGEAAFFAHVREFVQAAEDEDVDLLVLPELIVLELAPLHGSVQEGDLPRRLADEHWVRFVAETQLISLDFGLQIVYGSHFMAFPGGVSNVAICNGPKGISLHPKNRLTRYERNVWELQPGELLALTSDPRVGVAICYDLEFPECGRALAEAGATVLCAPSFTETAHGFHRMRHAAHARALENQVFVLHAALVGSLGREPVPCTHGSAAVIAPSHAPFPVNGVLAETPTNAEGLAIANLDFEALDTCRREGSVLNWADRGGEWRVEP